MLLLKTVSLKNFLSHEDTTIELKENEKLLIDGVSGSGKSSVFEAILWGLYGRGRVGNRSLVRGGSKSATVTLELIDRQPETDITRLITIRRSINSKDGKHKLEVEVDGQAHDLPGLTELDAWIETELIGASYTLFVNSVAYIQGGGENFLAQDATRRKELLLEIVKAEDYTQYYKKAKEKLDSYEIEMGVLKRVVEDTLLWLTENKHRVEVRDDIVSKINQNEELLKAEEAVLHFKEAIVSKHEAAKTSVDAWTATVKSRQADIARLVKDRDQAVLDIVEYNSLEAADTDYEKAKQEYETEDAAIQSKQTMLAEISTLQLDRASFLATKPYVRDRSGETNHFEESIKRTEEGPQCPSGDKCPYTSSHATDRESAKKRIAELIKLTSDETVAAAEWQTRADALPAIPSPDNILQELKELRKRRDGAINALDHTKERARRRHALLGCLERPAAIDGELAAHRESLIETELKLKEAERSVNIKEIDEALRLVGELYPKIKERRTVLSGLMTELTIVDGVKIEIEKRESDLQKAHITLRTLGEKKEKMTLLQQAMGPKGIKVLILDMVLPQIEARVNEILAELTDFRIRFDTQEANISNPGAKEGLFVKILNDQGGELEYESYSGGEKLKITVAISEAFASMSKVQFRLFDEAFFSLDDDSLIKFLEVIEKLFSRFSQIICVSHIQDIKDRFDAKVLMRKAGGITHMVT